MRFPATASLISLAGLCLAHADPAAAPAGQLSPRQASSVLVGYLSATSGVYTESRTCDFTATLSTSGSYVQCCPTSGACPFFTACSGETLVVGSTSVACDTLPGLRCNTAIIASTAGANGGPSNLACWQDSLGSSAFTLVQNIGSATFVPPSTTAGATSPGATDGSSATPGSSGSSADSSPSPTAGGSSSPIGIATPTPTKGAAASINNGLASGGVVAAAIALAQAVL